MQSERNRTRSRRVLDWVKANYIDMLIWLLNTALKSRPRPAQRSAGIAAIEGESPCQIFQDAVDQAAIEFDAALLLLQDRTEALLNCLEEHSEPAPIPAPMPALDLMEELCQYSVGN